MVNEPKPLTWVLEGACIRCTSHALSGKGYPAMLRRGRHSTIARHILIRRHGNIPSDLVARHTCDNRWCIRPDHIISGTIADNNRDRKERGRTVILRGEDNPNVKLTSIQARQILDAPGRYKETARRFGISVSCVEKIRARKLWKHI